MFDSVRPEFSFGSWVFQSSLGCLGPVIMLLFVASSLNLQDTLLPQLAEYALVAATGFALAVVIGTLVPGLVQEGIRIWILPVALELVAIAWASCSTGIGSIWYGFFYVPGPGRGEESIGVILTFPVWSSCWYSAGMWWRGRRQKKRSQTPSLTL